jgi:transposase
MAWKQAASVKLNDQEAAILRKIVHSKTLGLSLRERSQIVLVASVGLTNRQIVKDYGFEEHRVSQWRTRWHKHHEHWKQLDPELRPKMSAKLVRKWLADAEGRGTEPTITTEQRALILAVACDPPDKSGYPHTHWTDRLLAAEVVKRGIVETISHVWIWNFLKGQRPETAQKPILVESQHQKLGSVRK